MAAFEVKADVKEVASARLSNYMQIEVKPFPLVAQRPLLPKADILSTALVEYSRSLKGTDQWRTALDGPEHGDDSRWSCYGPSANRCCLLAKSPDAPEQQRCKHDNQDLSKFDTDIESQKALPNIWRCYLKDISQYERKTEAV